MEKALILDSEAVNALARASTRGALAFRALAVLDVAEEQGTVIRVPAAVLAEVSRSAALEAAVQRVLNARGIRVIDLTSKIARHAGRLLGRAKMDSTHAVDAFVVATAATFGSAIIATHDPDDLRRLASGLRHVRIFAV